MPYSEIQTYLAHIQRIELSDSKGHENNTEDYAGLIIGHAGPENRIVLVFIGKNSDDYKMYRWRVKFYSNNDFREAYVAVSCDGYLILVDTFHIKSENLYYAKHFQRTISSSSNPVVLCCRYDACQKEEGCKLIRCISEPTDSGDEVGNAKAKPSEEKNLPKRVITFNDAGRFSGFTGDFQNRIPLTEDTIVCLKNGLEKFIQNLSTWEEVFNTMEIEDVFAISEKFADRNPILHVGLYNKIAAKFSEEVASETTMMLENTPQIFLEFQKFTLHKEFSGKEDDLYHLAHLIVDNISAGLKKNTNRSTSSEKPFAAMLLFQTICETTDDVQIKNMLHYLRDRILDVPPNYKTEDLMSKLFLPQEEGLEDDNILAQIRKKVNRLLNRFQNVIGEIIGAFLGKNGLIEKERKRIYNYINNRKMQGRPGIQRLAKYLQGIMEADGTSINNFKQFVIQPFAAGRGNFYYNRLTFAYALLKIAISGHTDFKNNLEYWIIPFESL